MKAEAKDVLRDQRNSEPDIGDSRDQDEEDEDDDNNVRTNFFRIKGREGGNKFLPKFTLLRGFIRACGLFGSLPADELASPVPLHAFFLSFLGSYSAPSTPSSSPFILLHIPPHQARSPRRREKLPPPSSPPRMLSRGLQKGRVGGKNQRSNCE